MKHDRSPGRVHNLVDETHISGIITMISTRDNGWFRGDVNCAMLVLSQRMGQQGFPEEGVLKPALKV